MILPSRISDLMKRIEAGETVTREDVDRIATLQALDAARLAEDFVREAIARDAQSTARLAEIANA